MQRLLSARLVFLFIFGFYLFGFLSHAYYLKRTVYGDGHYYFSWLHTIVVDFDMNFQNEYTHFGLTRPDGSGNFHKNLYSIGPALLWSLFYTPVYRAFGGSGFEFVYQLVTGFSSLCFVIFGLILLYRLLLKEYVQSLSLYTVLTIALSTNLFFYGSVDTVNSHSLTFLAASIFLSFLYEFPKVSSLFLGLSFGLLGLIRMQDMIYGVYFFLLPIKKLIQNAPKVIFGLFMALLPQFIIWQLLHGVFYKSPYFAENALYFIPLQPKILEILFAPKNGLFLLTPVLLIAVGGLCLNIYRSHNKLYIIHLILFVLQLYVVSIRNEWWQDASFSGRMFVSILPQFAFGLAFIFKIIDQKWHWNTSKFIFAIASVSILNELLIVWYLWFH